MSNENSELLERGEAIAAIDAALDRSVARDGEALLLVGPAGIGKTTLLARAAATARARGLLVLEARGAEMEREFAFGIVRQLFEPLVADPARRSRLLAGAGALSASVIGADAPGLVAPDPSFAAYHGLYWLTANLAAERPLALIVDDLHWADEPSLRWLEFMVRRLDGVATALILGSRVTATASDPVPDAIATEPRTTRVGLSPLSVAASAELTRARLGEDADLGFCAACHETTGGNPFFLREVHSSLAGNGVAPTAANVELVRGFGPATVGESILARVAQLGAGARELAIAAAVLGNEFRIRDAAELAGRLENGGWVADADRLVGAEVLGASATRFAHPVIRSALYESIPPVHRSILHTRAARILAQRSGSEDEVAAHLLYAPPAADDWVVTTLRDRARAARRRGAPTVASTLLSRALLEPPRDGERWAVLAELGDAEVQFSPEAARATLRLALASASQPLDRAHVAIALGHALLLAADAPGAFAVVEEALTGMPDPADEQALALETTALLAAGCHVELAGRKFARAAELAALEGRTPGERAALGQVAFYAACAGAPPAIVAGVAARALARPMTEADEPVAAFSPALALVQGDLLAEANVALDAMIDRSREIGSAMWFAMASTIRAEARLREGRLTDAEADARQALSTGPDRETPAWDAMALATLVRTLDELGRIDEACDEYERRAAPGPLVGTAWGAILGHARGCLSLAQGEPGQALEALMSAGDVMRTLGTRSPAPVGWRADAALAQLALGDLDQARRLGQRNLELARAAGAPRSLGIALRVAALTQAPVDLALLTESAGALEASAARLEHARSLIELGAALRRSGARRDASERLTLGANTAAQVRAEPLLSQARDELRALGMRPRRLGANGIDALSPAELRVAQLAAEGLSNKEIAQTIFITVNTVQTHLSRVYSKLDISTRSALPDALGTGAPR
jgi:DNA-binding CsgD family transcriptional regulator